MAALFMVALPQKPKRKKFTGEKKRINTDLS
jgi:hypothetical protein